jgi:hypothetical protein
MTIIRRQRHARKGGGGTLKIRPNKSMAHWTFNIRFSYDTQFIFRFLMFAVGEDRNLKLLTRGPAPRHLALVYETSTYYSANPSTSDGSCSGLNPHTWPCYLSTMASQGCPIKKIILQSSTGALSSLSS